MTIPFIIIIIIILLDFQFYFRFLIILDQVFIEDHGWRKIVIKYIRCIFSIYFPTDNKELCFFDWR